VIFTTWLWGDKYPEEHVRRLAAGVKRHFTQPTRIVCFTDRRRGNLDVAQVVFGDDCRRLTEVPGCFARLWLFDPECQDEIKARPGESILNLDLDLIITGNLEWLDAIAAPFSILADVNSTNPCPYNGSVWQLKAGYRPDVWTDFSLEAYRAYGVPYHAFPDDQGWFYHKMPDAYRLGPHCGVWAFKKRGWNERSDALPDKASIVAFPGWRDPSKFENLPWIQQHWKG
jgi:hypothetical protein